MSPKKFETNAIRQQVNHTPYGEHSSPIFLTSSFVFEDAEHMRASFAEENDQNLYSRFSNPNTTEFIDKVVTMEGAQAGFAFASGMGAVFSTFAALLDSGDHIVSCQSVFGSTHALFTKFFPKWNIETSYFKVDQLETLESLIQPNTKIIYAESPTNPAVDILDLEVLGKLAKKHNLILIIDNCFATPYLQNPIKFGADLVIHSATKLMDGQGRVLGGVTVGNTELMHQIYLFSCFLSRSSSPIENFSAARLGFCANTSAVTVTLSVLAWKVNSGLKTQLLGVSAPTPFFHDSELNLKSVVPCPSP